MTIVVVLCIMVTLLLGGYGVFLHVGQWHPLLQLAILIIVLSNILALLITGVLAVVFKKLKRHGAGVYTLTIAFLLCLLLSQIVLSNPEILTRMPSWLVTISQPIAQDQEAGPAEANPSGETKQENRMEKSETAEGTELPENANFPKDTKPAEEATHPEDTATNGAADPDAKMNVLEKLVKDVLYSVKIIGLDGEYEDDVGTLHRLRDDYFCKATDRELAFVSALMSLLYILAPIIGGACLINLFKSIFPRLYLWCVRRFSWWHTMYYFSELNERALPLAESIREQVDERPKQRWKLLWAVWRDWNLLHLPFYAKESEGKKTEVEKTEVEKAEVEKAEGKEAEVKKVETKRDKIKKRFAENQKKRKAFKEKKQKYLFSTPVLVFTDAYLDDGNELSAEMMDAAKRIGAICIRDDLAHIKKGQLGRKKRIYFLLDMKEAQNLQTLSDLAGTDNGKYLKNAEVYLFSEDDICAHVENQIRYQLKTQPKKPMKDEHLPLIMPVQSYRNLVSDLFVQVPLYEPLVDGESPLEKRQTRTLTVTVLGTGQIGTEAFLNMIWLGQMLDVVLNIHIVSNETAERFKGRIDYRNPEILQSGDADWGPFLGKIRKQVDAKSYFKLAYHHMEIQSSEFEKLLENIENSPILQSDYMLVALGKDEDNLSVSEYMRRRVSEYHLKHPDKKTVIAYVLFDSDLCNSMKATEHKIQNNVYMHPFGSLKEAYHARNIFMESYTEDGDALNASYYSLQNRQMDREKRKQKNNYEIWSDIARAMHQRYKLYSMGLITDSIFLSEEKKKQDKNSEKKDETQDKNTQEGIRAQDENSQKVVEAQNEITQERIRAQDENSQKVVEAQNETTQEEIRAQGENSTKTEEKTTLTSHEIREAYLRNPTLENRLAWLEHRRWNAYMRSKGFRNTDNWNSYFKDLWTHKNMSLLLHPCLRECNEEKGMLSFGNGMGRLKILEERDDLDKLTWKMIDSYIEKIPLAVDKVIERAKKKLPRRKDELQIRYEAYQKDQMLIADLALISGWNSGNWDVLENILSSDSASKLKASYQDPPQDSELAGIKTCVAFREKLPEEQKKILADWNTGDILTLSYTVETVRRAYRVFLRNQSAEEKKIEKTTLWTRLKAYRSKLTEKDQNPKNSGEKKPVKEKSVYKKCLEWQNFFHVASKKSKDMQEKALQNAELARTLAKTACEKMQEIKKKWDSESAKVESESTTKASNLAVDDVEICFKFIMTFGDVGWYDFKQYDYPDECFPKS